MVKKLLAASVAAIGLLTASVASASTLKEIADSTYMLYGGNSPHCSIVAVSPTQFLTAHHCVEDTDDLNVRTIQKNDKFEKISEEVRYLKVLRTFKGKDIALLELMSPTTMPNLSYVDIAKSDFVPQFGDPLIVVGYPMVVDLTVTHGEFTGLVELPMEGMDGGFFKTTVPVTGGNSGGGLYAKFGDEFELIGMTSAGYRNVSFMSYFSTPKFIDDVTKGLLNTNKTTTKTDEAVEEESTKGKLINPADLR